MKTKICTDCKIPKKLKEFYKSKIHSQGVMVYCRTCFNQRCMKRWIERKIKAIKYKGSQCENCSLKLENTHANVFDFHHLKDKDYDWGQLRLRSWTDITTELDKCQLLCANCHRLVHSK